MVYEIIQISESLPSQKMSLNAREFKLHTFHNPLSLSSTPKSLLHPKVQALVSGKETHVKLSQFWPGGSIILTQCPDFNSSCLKVRLKNSQMLFFPLCPHFFAKSFFYSWRLKCRHLFLSGVSLIQVPTHGVVWEEK